MFDKQSFLALASEKILRPSGGVPKKELLTESRTGQRTHTKDAAAKRDAFDWKDKSEQIYMRDVPHSRRHSHVHRGDELRDRPMASSADGSPHSARPPRAALSANNIPRRLSAAMCVQGKAATAPLILPPHSHVRSTHPLKPSGRSNIRKSILSAFLRDHIHRAKRHPRSSCGLICGGSPGSALPPLQRPCPQRLTHSRPCGPRWQVPVPIPSAKEALFTGATPPAAVL